MEYFTIAATAVGDFLLTPYVIGVLSLFVFFNERSMNERDNNDVVIFPSFFAICFIGTIFYLIKDFGPLEYVIPAYFILGGVWSIYRYKYMIDYLLKKCNDEAINSNHGQFNPYLSKLKYSQPSNVYDRIVFWVIAWPISVVQHVLGNFFDFIEYIVKNVFGKTYNLIYKNAVDKIVEKDTFKTHHY